MVKISRINEIIKDFTTRETKTYGYSHFPRYPNDSALINFLRNLSDDLEEVVIYKHQLLFDTLFMYYEDEDYIKKEIEYITKENVSNEKERKEILEFIVDNYEKLEDIDRSDNSANWSADIIFNFDILKAEIPEILHKYKTAYFLSLRIHSGGDIRANYSQRIYIPLDVDVGGDSNCECKENKDRAKAIEANEALTTAFEILDYSVPAELDDIMYWVQLTTNESCLLHREDGEEISIYDDPKLAAFYEYISENFFADSILNDAYIAIPLNDSDKPELIEYAILNVDKNEIVASSSNCAYSFIFDKIKDNASLFKNNKLFYNINDKLYVMNDSKTVFVFTDDEKEIHTFNYSERQEDPDAETAVNYFLSVLDKRESLFDQ